MFLASLHQYCMLAAALLTMDLPGLTKSTPCGTALEDRSGCPGYRAVSPRRADRTGCETGSSIGQVNHELAFGFPTTSADWRSCDLPDYPEEKYVTKQYVVTVLNTA